MRSKKYNENKRIKKRRIFETILSVAILLSLIGGGFTGYYGSKIVSFLDEISGSNYSPEENDMNESLEQLIYFEDAEPFAALILGTDVEENRVSRSDAIIVVTINPEINSGKMLSIPRDTLITLPNGTIEKINAAYSTGGASLTRKIIGDKLGIPIHYYASMDFRGLVELVDAIGGIQVTSEIDFRVPNFKEGGQPIQIHKGIQTLDGGSALGYARMRKEDPRGDFGRQDRQKEVIIEILKELVSFDTLTNITTVLNSIEPYLQTNASSSEMLAIFANYTDTLNSVEQLSLNGEAGSKYFPHYDLEVYIWEPYEYSVQEVSQELREHLGVDLRDDIEAEDTITNSVIESDIE